MKGCSGASTRRVKETQRRSCSAHIPDPSSVSMSPTLLPTPRVSPTSHRHQREGGGAGDRSPRRVHSSARDKAYDENDASE
ncbi:hypothetical protein VZT92_007003 [Zoarces viviparus]|uniref:Uncharacterized protein n=1 Tax=Zoarces viviparus TaxID=48416 RepID=A0AAW1FLN5_ZOAVI